MSNIFSNEIGQGDSKMYATFKMDDAGVPHLAAFVKDGIVILLGEGDEMLTGYYLEYPGIIAEGGTFSQVKLYLEELKAIIPEHELEEMRLK